MAKLMMPQIKDLSADSAKHQGWTSKTLAGQLGYIAKGMDVRNAKYHKGNVSSIPDVWAKPRLFEMLLFGKNVNKADGSGQSDVNLRQRVVGEWRCVLAMLALCKVKPSLQLEAEAVNIERNGGILEEIFLAVPPKDTVDEQTVWNKLYLLKYQGVPFAMTSPTTLVSVAADYSGALKDKSVDISEPWAVKNDYGDIVLADPTDKLDPSECYHIWYWVKNLLKHLRDDAKNGTGNVQTDLCKQLEEYQKDLAIRFEEAGIPKRDLPVGEKYLNMSEGIFRFLDAPINPPDPQASDSFVKIQPSEGKNPERLWLFVDTKYLGEMAKAWNVDPNRMFIWGNTSINEINNTMLDDNKRNRIGETLLKYSVGEKNDAEEKYCEWVRADDFFTEHLYIIDGAPNIFANVFNPGANDEYSIVPPISKRLLEYFSVDYIQENFKIDIRPDDTIVARFRLPFVYTDERGKEKDREFWLEKEYPEDLFGEYRKSLDSYYAPIAEVWPNKRVYDDKKKNVWNKYYFCFITPDCDDSTEIEEDILLLTPWSSATGEKDWKGESIQRANKYTVRLKEFPEALICRVLWKYSNSSKEEDVGVLIVKQPTEAATLTYNRNWEVGMDFGTSSTMLYYKQESDKAKALSLHPNLFTIISKEDRDIPLLINFIKPIDDEISNGSFLSVYHPLKGNRQTERVEPLTEGHVLSLNAGQQESLMGAVENMVPNLKWSTKDGGSNDLQYKKKMVRAYIEQICLQTTFEAAQAKADKIIWKFSYPTAFSQQEYDDFQTMIKEAVEKAMEDTPYALEGSQSNLPGRYEMDKDLWAESVAAATYFKNQGRSNFAQGAICLDIGAGTTDISVVSPRGSQILYHASVIYAGRIFFKPVFAWLEKCALSDGGATAGVSDEDKKKALLDAAMREKSKEKLKQIRDIISSGKDETREAVEAMLQIPQLAMAGLFYYVGMLLKVLKEQNIFQGDTIPNIYVGGNGARIFHWFCRVSEDNDISSNHLSVLKQAILASSGFDESDFDIVMSREPKAEVAAGMLAEEYDDKWFAQSRFNSLIFGNESDLVQYQYSPLIAGEYITFYKEDTGQTEDVLADEFLCAKDIADGVIVKDLPNIEKLLQIFDENRQYEGVIWGEGLNSENIMRELVDATIAYYSVDQKGRDLKRIHVEPVFIEAMESLVDILTDRLKARL